MYVIEDTSNEAPEQDELAQALSAVDQQIEEQRGVHVSDPQMTQACSEGERYGVDDRTTSYR